MRYKERRDPIGRRREELQHRVLWFLAGCFWLLSSVPPPATGSAFPPTAFATSQSTLPEYVDPACLIFVFPQRGGITQSQILGLYLGGSIYEIGALGNWRGQSFFFLSQDTPLGQGTSLFHVGWGASWKPLRLGLVGRASRQERSNAQIYKEETRGQIDYSGAENSLYEVSFGIGFGGEELDVDLAVEGSRIDSKLSDLYLRQDMNPNYSDTTLVYLESDDDIGFASVARIRARLGRGVEVVALGRWGSLSNNYDGLEYVNSRLNRLHPRRDLERWSAGLSVSFPTTHLDWVGMTAHYDHVEDLTRLDYNENLEYKTTETGRLAIALRQHLWRDLHGQAGVSLAYVKDDRERESLASDGTRRQYLTSSTSFNQDFSWGVSYIWRNFDLRAAVRETLPALDLFFALDVSLHL